MVIATFIAFSDTEKVGMIPQEAIITSKQIPNTFSWLMYDCMYMYCLEHKV